MARRRSKRTGNADRATGKVDAYRHDSAKRVNNPPAKIAAEGVVPPIPKAQYACNPHLPPVLRFDVTGRADQLPDLLAKAARQPVTLDEARRVRQYVLCP